MSHAPSGQKRPALPARAARIAAGLSAEAAGKRLRVTARYLLHCERTGFPLILAERAARLYQVPLSHYTFLALGRGSDRTPRGSTTVHRRREPGATGATDPDEARAGPGGAAPPGPGATARGRDQHHLSGAARSV